MGGVLACQACFFDTTRACVFAPPHSESRDVCDAFLHHISSLAPNGGELPQWGVLRDDPRKTGAYGARSTRPLLEVVLCSHAVQASFQCISRGPWGFAVQRERTTHGHHRYKPRESQTTRIPGSGTPPPAFATPPPPNIRPEPPLGINGRF